MPLWPRQGFVVAAAILVGFGIIWIFFLFLQIADPCVIARDSIHGCAKLLEEAARRH